MQYTAARVHLCIQLNPWPQVSIQPGRGEPLGPIVQCSTSWYHGCTRPEAPEIAAGT